MSLRKPVFHSPGHLAILHTWHEKMAQHHPRAECVVSGNAGSRSEHYPSDGEMKMMCGTSRLAKAMVMMAVVMAKLVVMSRRCPDHDAPELAAIKPTLH